MLRIIVKLKLDERVASNIVSVANDDPDRN